MVRLPASAPLNSMGRETTSAKGNLPWLRQVGLKIISAAPAVKAAQASLWGTRVLGLKNCIFNCSLVFSLKSSIQGNQPFFTVKCLSGYSLAALMTTLSADHPEAMNPPKRKAIEQTIKHEEELTREEIEGNVQEAIMSLSREDKILIFSSIEPDERLELIEQMEEQES